MALKSSNKIDYSYTKSDSTKGSPIKNKNKVYVPSQTISLLDNNYQNNVKSNSLSKNDSKKKSQNVFAIFFVQTEEKGVKYQSSNKCNFFLVYKK